MNEIEKTREAFAKNNLMGIAFDIDEVLSFTVKHWVESLQNQFGNPENLSFQEIINKYRYTQLVPYWQTKKALAYMDQLMNDDKLQDELPVVEGAKEAVKQINKIIPIVLYPTVRPQSIRAGTKRWLTKNEFPTAQIIARPKNVRREDGNTWKAKLLESLYPYVRGIVDDNPGLPASLSHSYKGVVFVYGSKDHPLASDRVVPCPTWESVIESVSAIKWENEF
jgi:5'(3')-deoxyribonucleotidase